jgi:hypothetical protein
VGGSDFAALTLTNYGQNMEMRQQFGKLVKLETKSRTPLTSGPLGSISRSHRALPS